MARLLDQYNTTIATGLAEKFKLANKMAIPKLEKIVINMGVGRATQDKALLEAAVDSLSKISGQKPQVTRAKVSVSGFRLREGNEIGCKVTLRGRRMYEFLDRLISVALPRIRDFRGLNPNSFDGHGNYTLGLAEQVVFPEIDADRLQHTQGMDITIVTTTENDDQARELLACLRLPVPPAWPAAAAGPGEVVEPRALASFFYKDSTRPDPFGMTQLHVDQSPDDQVGDAPQVRGPASEPLQALRTAPRCLPQVRHLPDLLPQPGQPGPDPGGQEG